MSGNFIAIDPGREKCGMALMDGTGALLSRRIVESKSVGAAAAEMAAAAGGVSTFVIGNGTGEKDVSEAIRCACGEVEIVIVEEKGTTEQARALYFEHNPPRGILRLLPKGLRVPPGPVDDFAAAAIGGKYLSERNTGK